MWGLKPKREIQIKVEIGAEEVMKEGVIDKLLKKIQRETKDFPHVKVRLDITWGDD